MLLVGLEITPDFTSHAGVTFLTAVTAAVFALVLPLSRVSAEPSSGPGDDLAAKISEISSLQGDTASLKDFDIRRHLSCIPVATEYYCPFVGFKPIARSSLLHEMLGETRSGVVDPRDHDTATYKVRRLQRFGASHQFQLLIKDLTKARSEADSRHPSHVQSLAVTSTMSGTAPSLSDAIGSDATKPLFDLIADLEDIKNEPDRLAGFELRDYLECMSLPGATLCPYRGWSEPGQERTSIIEAAEESRKAAAKDPEVGPSGDAQPHDELDVLTAMGPEDQITELQQYFRTELASYYKAVDFPEPLDHLKQAAIDADSKLYEPENPETWYPEVQSCPEVSYTTQFCPMVGWFKGRWRTEAATASEEAAERYAELAKLPIREQQAIRDSLAIAVTQARSHPQAPEFLAWFREARPRLLKTFGLRS